MSTASKPNHISPARYLEIERESSIRHEYYCGEMFAMAGGSRNHNSIALNIAGELRQPFKHKPCDVFALDMKDNAWRIRFYHSAESILVLETLGVELSMAEIYSKVTFEELEQEPDRPCEEVEVHERRPAFHQT